MFLAMWTQLQLLLIIQYNCYISIQEAAKIQKTKKHHFLFYSVLPAFQRPDRNFTEMMCDYGLNISYDQVLEISVQLGDAVITKYVEGVVRHKLGRLFSKGPFV